MVLDFKDFSLDPNSSLVQDLLVPLEIKDLAAALVTLHNPSLVNLSHVQVEGATVAERHRVTSGTFERP